MGDVFSQADKVIVWLGELTHEERTKAGSTAIQVLERINFNFYQQSQKWMGLYVQFSKVRGETVLRRLVNGASIDQVSWKPVQTLLSRPWFHRLWVYQEVANAKHVVVAYDTAEMPWTELSGALSYLSYHNWIRSTSIRYLPMLARMWWQWRRHVIRLFPNPYSR
jgi:hypothetical protein